MESNYKINDTVSFCKTISESDVYLFAGITGDLAANHINAKFMEETNYGKRIAHGVLLIGFTSAACTEMAKRSDAPSVSYGYNSVRFINPVFIGDTIKASYKIKEIDNLNSKLFSEIKIINQDGQLCMVGEHILKFIL